MCPAFQACNQMFKYIWSDYSITFKSHKKKDKNK